MGDGSKTQAEVSKFYLATAGSVNNAAFLEYLTGEVRYVGPVAVWEYTISGNRRLMIDYEFEVDNYKWFNDALLPSGSVAVNTGSISATACYGSSALEAGFGPMWPEQNSFSGFTT